MADTLDRGERKIKDAEELRNQEIGKRLEMEKKLDDTQHKMLIKTDEVTEL